MRYWPDVTNSSSKKGASRWASNAGASPTDGSTTGDTGGFFFSGSLASGVVSWLLFQSVGDTGAKVAGDIFYLTGIDGVASTGYGQSYVLTTGWTQGETGVGSGTGAYFWPRLKGSGTTLVAATFLTGTRRQNLFGHRSAFRLVMRDPRQGVQGMPSLTEYVLYIDPRTGMPLLIGFTAGDLMVTISVKAMWTWASYRPEWACVLAG